MAIPNIERKYIIEAIKFIEENGGVPNNNLSKKYDLVWENGKTYPPKYVVAVANHLKYNADINKPDFNSIEAKKNLKTNGFTVRNIQEEFELTITAKEITSNDEDFSIDNIGLGDRYKPVRAFFLDKYNNKIERKREKNEKRISNQTLPRIAFQIYENQIKKLSNEEKENFPVCKYGPDTETICGIFSSIEEIQKYRNIKSNEYLRYKTKEGNSLVIYSWNIFTTIRFVKTCLERFGNDGDCFKLIYKEKSENEMSKPEEEIDLGEFTNQNNNYIQNYSRMLMDSKNIIFRGAPGTGKTYLARQIAANIISDGKTCNYTELTQEQKQQMEFVQFHPSYDYTDFVEGLRPKINDDGSLGFELKNGIFKEFVEKARKNYENSNKTTDIIEKELSIQEAMDNFFSEIYFDKDKFSLNSGNSFYIKDIDDEKIYIYNPSNEKYKDIVLKIDRIKKMLESETKFEKLKDIANFWGHSVVRQEDSYYFIIYNKIMKKKRSTTKEIKKEELKKYVFIIDEINRGEISKILGELFFSIDPGYRGKAGEISTQYSNLHTDDKEKFYIPENVYIIGTMNDIDRSVDSFDFAMRRRFRFIEIKANDRLEMLKTLNDEEKEAEAIRRMTALNNEIIKAEGLNENYQIGAAYFLKSKEIDFDELWTDYLMPLLQEYINGMYNEEEILNKFKEAYDNEETDGEIDDESN